MKPWPLPQGRTLAVIAVMVPLLALFVYVALRSGPLAPVSVTAVRVAPQVLTPGLFGIGVVDARYVYRIGPTSAGRLKRLDVHVGDAVRAGQAFGEMDAVDLDDRLRAQSAMVKRAQAVLNEAQSRHAYARMQAQRYDRLFATRSSSEEQAQAKQQELLVAEAALSVAREDLSRARSELDALTTQRGNLRLVAPVDGVVSVRAADPGTTLVSGQAAVEVIDPKSLWVNARFDQSSAVGLSAGLPARIVLRSRSGGGGSSVGGKALAGRVLRLEPRADAVTEEILAKVVFDAVPEPLPPVGELAEVSLDLQALAPAIVIPHAAVRRHEDQLGVWVIVDGEARFMPVKLGRGDLEGRVQVLQGLKQGDQIVLYSDKPLAANRAVKVLARMPGVHE